MTNPNDPYARERAVADPRLTPAGVPERYVERERVVAERAPVVAEPAPNPAAGILLILGGLMGVLAGLVPAPGAGQIPLAGTVDAFGTGDSNAIVVAVAIILVFLCGLGALAAGAQMFAPKWHAGPARTGMTMGIIMLACAIAVLIIAGTQVFDGAGFSTWMLLLAGIPVIIGALVGFARK